MMGPPLIETPTTVRPRTTLLHATWFFGAYAVAVWVGHLMRLPDEPVGSPIWPASGVYLATLALQPRRVWPIIAGLAAVVFVGGYTIVGSTPLGTSLGLWFTNSLTAFVGVLLLRLILGRVPDLTFLKDVLILVAVGLLLSPTARIGTWLFAIESPHPLEDVWQVWWLGDLLGILTLGGLIFAWRRRNEPALWRGGPRELVALIVMACVVAGAIYFWESKPHASVLGPPTMMFPLLIWASLRFGPLGASFSGLLLSFLFLATTNADFGPFVEALGMARIPTIVWIQLGLVIGTAIALAVAATMAERDRAELRNLRHLEELARVDKMTSLGTLVASIAHEINSPNQLLLLNLPALESIWNEATEVLDAHHRDDPAFRLANTDYEHARTDAGKLLSDTLGAAERVRGIVEELRNYTRIGRRDPREFDLNESVRGALVILAARVRKATRSFAVELSHGLPAITGDPRRMEQVVVNLIVNGCEALENRSQALRVRTSHRNGRVVLTVRDEGHGMTSEQIERVGEPFFTTKAAGTGLGLTVTTQIVEEHDGSLEFESQPGVGTTVTVSLPAA